MLSICLWTKWYSSSGHLIHTFVHFQYGCHHLHLTPYHHHYPTQSFPVFHIVIIDQVKMNDLSSLSAIGVDSNGARLGKIHSPDNKNNKPIEFRLIFNWFIYLRRVKIWASFWVQYTGICSQHEASNVPLEYPGFRRNRRRHLVHYHRHCHCFVRHFDLPLIYNTNRLTFF